MSTNFTTPALYVRSNKYFIPLRRPACGGICLPISPHPLFTFDQTNILISLRRPPCGGICLPISPHPLFTFDQTNILYRCGVPPAAGYVYQFHHTRSLRSIKQIFYTVCGGVPP